MTTRAPHPTSHSSSPEASPPAAGQGGESLARGYAAARSAAVMIDLSERGQVQVSGRDRLDLLQRLTTNDMKSLAPGRGVVNLFLTNKGRLVEMFDALAFPEHLHLVLASSGGKAAVEWIERFVFMEDVQAMDVTAERGAIGVFGPKAADVLAAAGIDVTGLAARDYRSAHLGAGIEVIAGPCEPLAGNGYRLLGARSNTAVIVSSLLAAGADVGLVQAGEDLLEVLRIEAGWPGAGRELTEDWNPLESELRSYISFTKGCYTGQEVIARLNTYKKVQRALRGLRIHPAAGAGDARVPAPGSELRDDCGGAAAVGTVTSAAYSPGLGGAVALAFVELARSAPGTKLRVEVGGVPAEAEVVALPIRA